MTTKMQLAKEWYLKGHFLEKMMRKMIISSIYKLARKKNLSSTKKVLYIYPYFNIHETRKAFALNNSDLMDIIQFLKAKIIATYKHYDN